ncbi:PRTRC system protein B [Mucilaginibacter sp. SMC90]|uniref:PRTRC system protein B n=1 Tax=Mucilaginibacter sp. SMC90 TaxID=2929803 RepID=UPI001FB38090|nr:PRTRC system protein B [Mucilaginibacter sp. SMC90]UOE47890.1 PRTRC system protein B [Mucilaginibacter sp. SMC90]
MQRNITNNISHNYTPVKAMLIYSKSNNDQEDEYGPEEVYVESYDIGHNGRPINAHPLSVKECYLFGEMLRSAKRSQNSFLKCRGILPPNLLYLGMEREGFAVWHTPPMERKLYFVESLGIPSAAVKIPAMLWKGSRESLSVYALKGNRKPLLNSPVFHAPYFNMYGDGRVCMGTVDLKIDAFTCLEDFIRLWEDYFFNSYFSHTIDGGSNAGKNIVQLWQEQAAMGQKFPEEQLISTGKTLVQIIR